MRFLSGFSSAFLLGRLYEWLTPLAAFEQFVDHDREQQAGTGMGLAFCKQLTKRMGGDLVAQSEGPGKGASFTASFSLSAVQTAELPPSVRETLKSRIRFLEEFEKKRVFAVHPTLMGMGDSKVASILSRSFYHHSGSPMRKLDGMRRREKEKEGEKGRENHKNGEENRVLSSSIWENSSLTVHAATVLLMEQTLQWRHHRLLVVAPSCFLQFQLSYHSTRLGFHIDLIESVDALFEGVRSAKVSLLNYTAVLLEDSHTVRPSLQAFRDFISDFAVDSVSSTESRERGSTIPDIIIVSDNRMTFVSQFVDDNILRRPLRYDRFLSALFGSNRGERGGQLAQHPTVTAEGDQRGDGERRTGTVGIAERVFPSVSSIPSLHESSAIDDRKCITAEFWDDEMKTRVAVFVVMVSLPRAFRSKPRCSVIDAFP